jgi:DNA repair protein SbcD/Mre11
VIINSGDLIDHSKVSHTEIERVVDALAELAAIAPTVVVAGNHDNFSLLRYLDRLGRLHRLHFISKPLGIDGNHLQFPGRDGNTLRLGALPFVAIERSIDVTDDPRRWAGDYRGRIADLQAKIAADLGNGFDPRTHVTVFAAHLHVTGAGLTGSERARHCNDDYACDPDAIPAVDYAAFGHIHDPQPIPGKVFGRYAGSPIPLDFGEAGQRKSVTLVTLEPGSPATCKLIPVRGGRALYPFEGTWAQLQQQANAIGDALCLVKLHTDVHDPVLAQRVHDLLPRATVVQVEQRVAGTQPGSIVVEPGTAPVQRHLIDSFASYLQQVGTPTAPAADVQALMAEFLAADEEDREPHFAVEALLDDDQIGAQA